MDHSEFAAIEGRCNKLEGAFHTCKNLYKSKSLSRNLKLCHYNTVIRPSALYAAETLLMTKKGALRKLELKDRKILRKILGPINENGNYRRRHNNELFDHIEDLVTVMRKRRMQFYGHLERMDPKRLTHRIHSCISKKPSYAKWTIQVKKDLEEARISHNLIWNRTEFRDAVKSTNNLKPLTSTTARPNSKWTAERKADHSSRMKIYWQKRKNQL
uniref:Endonuclease-reverse transcriptase n=1 Tax=Cacopsylla melanoneura TaxID=428564 RepID=A0A8D8RKU7_9HEMI